MSSSERKFPWVSSLALLYPLCVAIIMRSTTPAPMKTIIGYAIAQLGYVLLGVSVFSRSFGVFRLGTRKQVIGMGVLFLVLGTIICQPTGNQTPNKALQPPPASQRSAQSTEVVMHTLRSFTFWIITILLFCTIFVMQLNGYLRGRFKPHIDAVVGTCWVVLLVLSFVFFDWKIGLIYVVGSFVVGAIIQPVAASLASRLLRQV